MSAPTVVLDAQSKVQETADDAAMSKLYVYKHRAHGARPQTLTYPLLLLSHAQLVRPNGLLQ